MTLKNQYLPCLHLCHHLLSYPERQSYVGWYSAIKHSLVTDESAPFAYTCTSGPEKVPQQTCNPAKRAKPLRTSAMNLMMTRWHRNNVNHLNQEESVCVETYKCKKKSKCLHDWIPEIGLSKSDRETLLNPVGFCSQCCTKAAQGHHTSSRPWVCCL